MAIKRNTEKDLTVSSSAAGAAPARRKSAPKPRTQYAPVSSDLAPEAEQPETVPTVPAIAIAEPSREAIAKLAYSFWVARGYQSGSEEQDWLRAELQLRQGISA